MPRLLARSLQVAFDCAVLTLAYYLAFLFRFEFSIPASQAKLVLVNLPYVVAVQYASLYVFAVPKVAWRYMTMRDAARVMIAMSASTALLVAVRVTAPNLVETPLVFLPLGVLAMDFVLGFVGLVGMRSIWRMRGEVQGRKKRSAGG